MLVELSQCVFGYGPRPVVQVDRLEISEGECLGVFGPNGSGKTTLVAGIAGLRRPMAGTVWRSDRTRFSFLPQHRSLERQWPMSGLDAAGLAVSAWRPLGWLGGDSRRVRAQMDALGVRDLAARRFSQLSGGQQLRVLLAGALAAEPQILILDEPTDGLDVRSRAALLEILRAETGTGLCAILISHDVEDLLEAADRVAWLHVSQEPQAASRVEIVDPAELGRRVAAGGR
jgi:ABC-type Mn2+/Zn2+ transport system ATPase subunit